MSNITIIDYNAKYGPEAVTMWRASMEKALGITDPHSPVQQLAFLKAQVANNHGFLAINNTTETVVGLMVQGGCELEQLYVHIDYQGQGIGTRLLNLAKALAPGYLQLYAFAVNTGAQRFYKKHGFYIIGRGIEPDSGMEDIRYEWRASQSLPAAIVSPPDRLPGQTRRRSG